MGVKDWIIALLIVLVLVVVWLASLSISAGAERPGERRGWAFGPKWMQDTVVATAQAPAAAPAPAPAAAPAESKPDTAQPETAQMTMSPVSANDKPADTPKEGFCPKLMQRAGFCDAGESMNPLRGTFQDLRPSAVLPGGKTSWLQGFEPERFATARPGRGTVWDGVMTASNLPI